MEIGSLNQTLLVSALAATLLVISPAVEPGVADRLAQVLKQS